MIEQQICRHILGTINGQCVSCGQKLDFEQRQYNNELRRMLSSSEARREVLPFRLLEEIVR